MRRSHHRHTAQHPSSSLAPDRRTVLKASLAGLTLGWAALTSSPALAQNAASAWPSKPITLIVTYPPGGGADAMARLVAPKMADALGQPVVVENRPGASGQIGANLVAKAAPDGYTLMLDASSFAANPALYAKITYDSNKAFRPIGVIALFPNVVLVNAAYPAKSVKDLAAMAKASKDAVAYASSGNGSAQHLAGALFEASIGADMLHIPYKGGGPALTDVIGGQVPLFFGNLASTLQHVQSGKLRALAVTSSKRSDILPDVPTLAESDVKGAEIHEWNAIFAPAGTPESVIDKLAAALQKALQSAEVKARIAQLGGDIQTGGPQAAQEFIQAQMSTMGKIIKAKGITLD